MGVFAFGFAVFRLVLFLLHGHGHMESERRVTCSSSRYEYYLTGSCIGSVMIFFNRWRFVDLFFRLYDFYTLAYLMDGKANYDVN